VDPLTYDAAGRLKTIPGIVSEILYNAAGAATNQTNVNGTVTARAYSPERGFLTNITTTGAGTIQQLGYLIDGAGMASQATSPLVDEQFTYTYDDLHRLTDAASPTQSQSFTYEAQTGNMTYNSRVGAYSYPTAGSSRPHAPTSVAGSPTLTYDNNGNLLAGNGRAIQWTADNLPSQVGTTQFAYDGIGERVAKTSSGSTSLYPFGDDYEITNGTITKYVSVDGLGVIAKRVGSSTYWMHTDRLGSVQAITDATGSELQHRTYRPYGDKIADTTSHTESRGYISERQDTETGLTYLHARYYDSARAQFVSPDLLNPTDGFVGLNRYAYGLGNPLHFADPFGGRVTCRGRQEDCGCEDPEPRNEGDVPVPPESTIGNTPWQPIVLPDIGAVSVEPPPPRPTPRPSPAPGPGPMPSPRRPTGGDCSGRLVECTTRLQYGVWTGRAICAAICEKYGRANPRSCHAACEAAIDANAPRLEQQCQQGYEDCMRGAEPGTD
jgi:RHS repeat-associated protein